MKTASQVFDEWAGDQRAQKMGARHWPLVRQGFALLPESAGRYLEVGVGNGYSIRYAATHVHRRGTCLGVDASPRMVDLAREATADLDNVTIERASFLESLFSPEERTFATIFSMEVFYYFPDIQAGLDKAASLLGPHGRLIVMVDFYEENPESHGWPEEVDTPMTLWSQAQYHAGFDKAGLVDVEQHVFHEPAVTHSDSTKGAGTLCTLGVHPAP